MISFHIEPSQFQGARIFLFIFFSQCSSCRRHSSLSLCSCSDFCGRYVNLQVPTSSHGCDFFVSPCFPFRQSLLQRPLLERRKLLRSTFKEVEGRFRFATFMDHKVKGQTYRPAANLRQECHVQLYLVYPDETIPPPSGQQRPGTAVMSLITVLFSSGYDGCLKCFSREV